VLAPRVASGSIALLVIAGPDVCLGWYAMIANRYSSGLACIQADRGHRVVSVGPCRRVRHPGYVSAIVSCLGMPALFESAWAWLTAVLLVVIVIVRTQLEDAALRAELEGYQVTADRVRYRLLSGE
jgi:protein-S-isoprenylcysteine O-methyltransferase Ste14